ncbi:ABC transporter permease [Streptomyces sparsogenes]|uniref:ABC transporter permease n=1 Tax=Streptomyces sparsogenes TaxID=67365 RepID=UPI0033F9899D
MWTLFLVQLSNWRWSWPGMVVTGMVAPVLTLAAMGVFAKESGGQAVHQVFVGSLTLALLFETQNKVANNFAFMKFNDAFHFYAALPVRPQALIVATAGAFTLLALPALVCTTLFGVLILGLKVSLSPLVVPVVLAVVLPFVGIGAWIGSRAKNPEEAGSLSVLCVLAMVSLGPVAVPDRLLPDFMVWIGWANPAFYASSLLRQVFFGPIDGTTAGYAGVLLGCLLLMWVLTSKRIAGFGGAAES